MGVRRVQPDTTRVRRVCLNWHLFGRLFCGNSVIVFHAIRRNLQTGQCVSNRCLSWETTHRVHSPATHRSTYSFTAATATITTDCCCCPSPFICCSSFPVIQLPSHGHRSSVLWCHVYYDATLPSSPVVLSCALNVTTNVLYTYSQCVEWKFHYRLLTG